MLFYFTLKSLFVIKIFNLCLHFLIMQKNDLIRKIRLISKFTTSQPGKQTIAIHILHHIPRSKRNQTMKFGQLIEYNMRNIFLKKWSAKCGGETFATPFSKNQSWACLRINSLKFCIVSLNCMPSWELSKCIEAKLQTTCFYHI